MEEVWKPVEDYEGLYEVSNLGNVKSIGPGHRRKRGNLSPEAGKYGHKRVLLYKDGQREKWLVHRLVAFAFLGVPPEKYEVNHIDFDPTNNHVDNLEWVPHRDNILHSRDRLARKRGESHGRSKLTAEQAQAIKDRYAQGGISFAKLAKEFDVSPQQCHKIVRGMKWAHL